MKGKFLIVIPLLGFSASLLLPASNSRADNSQAKTVLLQIPDSILGGDRNPGAVRPAQPRASIPESSLSNPPVAKQLAAPVTVSRTAAAKQDAIRTVTVLPSAVSHTETKEEKAERLLSQSTGPTVTEQLQQTLAPLRLRFERNLDQLKDNLFTYRTPAISGNYRLQTADILSSAGLTGKSWIWERTPEDIQNRIEQLPWIEQAQLQVGIFPSSVSITVKEAEPWLVAEYEGSSWLVSSSGELLQTLSSIKNPDLVIEVGELPRLDGLEAQPEEESYLASANARFVYAAKLVKFIEMGGEIPFPFDRITLLKTGGLRVTPVDKQQYPEVLLAASSLEEAGDALQRLSLVLGDLEKRNERAKQIDLRFNNQAILR